MDKYLSALHPNVVIPKRLKLQRNGCTVYVFSKNSLQKYLKKNNIETKIHYPIPLNKQKAARGLRLSQKQFKNANYQSLNLLTLPIHQYLNGKQIRYIAKKIKNFYKK